MFKSILVTLDGSPFSEAVLPFAREMCQSGVTRITLIRVVDVPSNGQAMSPVDRVPRWTSNVLVRETVDQKLERIEDEVQTYLEGHARTFPDSKVDLITEVIFSDKVAESIVEYARGGEVDAILMSTHGRTGLASVLMGSTPAKVLRAWRWPVLLICPDIDERSQAGAVE